MTAHPIPSDFEARTNATYEALMWALSRPGLPRPLPQTGQAAIIETLIDRECAVYCDNDTLAGVARRTAADLVAPEAADHLFLSQVPEAALLGALRQGTDMYPEDGATLILPATLSAGDVLRLAGPGVDGHVDLAISGIPVAFWAARKATMRYPMGFEIFVLDGDQVVGLPRTTSVEVL